MKTKQIVTICDLDTTQTEATKTLSLSIGKRKFVLDLCQQHYDEMDASLRNLIDRIKGVSKTSSSAHNGYNPADVRAWAVEQGYEVSSAGPIPKAIKEAYAEAS